MDLKWILKHQLVILDFNLVMTGTHCTRWQFCGTRRQMAEIGGKSVHVHVSVNCVVCMIKDKNLREAQMHYWCCEIFCMLNIWICLKATWITGFLCAKFDRKKSSLTHDFVISCINYCMCLFVKHIVSNQWFGDSSY